MKLINDAIVIMALAITAFCLSVPPVFAFDQWPDTGQTNSYTDTFGEDSDYEGPRSYTKLGYGDVELPDTATQADGWLMTRDNVTGLIWEIKTDDGSIHDKDNRYTWYTASSTFIAAVNNDIFGGHNDWRMSTVKELTTLVNSNIPYPGPTIDTSYFPGTVSSIYWSSTTYASYTSYAWLVYFGYGDVYYYYKSYSYRMRAVRSGQ